MCGAAEGGAGCTGDSRVVDARGSARAARHGWSGAQGPSWAEERSPQQRHAPPPARLLRPRLRSANSPASDVMRGPWACGAWGACANPPSPTAAARLGEPSRLVLTRGAPPPHPTPASERLAWPSYFCFPHPPRKKKIRCGQGDICFWSSTPGCGSLPLSQAQISRVVVGRGGKERASAWYSG